MNNENAADFLDLSVKYLTGAFPFSAEFQNVGMAVQGAMNVRKGPNKNRNLHWFHAFALSVVAGFGGGIFNFIWLGKPSGLIANDLCMGSCIIAFLLVNALPFDLGFMFCNTLPMEVVITSSAQLFRSLGICKFCKAAFNMFQDTPSAYYPTPVFGPIIYATLLGNMGPFLMKGFEGHIANGMPWAVQNGIFCATFYLFYGLDTKGPIGEMLRTYLSPFSEMFALDDETFACVFVSLFMQIIGILQMPQFLGPSFTPFGLTLLSPFLDSTTWSVGKGGSVYAEKQRELKLSTAAVSKTERNEQEEKVVAEQEGDGSPASKRKRKKKKKKSNDVKEKEL